MKGLLHILGLFTILEGSLISEVYSHEAQQGSSRRLGPTDNVIDTLNQERMKGKYPRLILTAFFDRDEHSGLKGQLKRVLDSSPFEVKVVLTDPSVDDSTSLSIDGSQSKPTNSTIEFLVADHQGESVPNDEFVFLVADEERGTIRGLVQKENRLYTWDQVVGKEAVVSEAHVVPPDNWTCAVVDQTLELENSRRLQEHHEHKHPQHSHDTSGLIKNIAAQLGVEKMNMKSRRRMYGTNTFPNAYSYQVDLYIEVDTAMVSFQDPSDPTNMPNTGKSKVNFHFRNLLPHVILTLSLILDSELR